MDWTQIIMALSVSLVAYFVGFNRGVRFCIDKLQELDEDQDPEDQNRVVSCRAELVGGTMYLYDESDGGEKFLAQGTDLAQLTEHVIARVGSATVQIVNARDPEKAWFKQFGKDT